MIHTPQFGGDVMSNLYWLTETQMERLLPYSSKEPRQATRR